MACEECSLFHREKLVNRKGGFYHFLESPLQVPPTPRFFNWGVYYRWEKLGPGNPALCPLKRAQITLDFSYNSFILSSQILEVASDQEAPDAGLQHRHPPHQPLPLHPGANRPAAGRAPASCVTSLRRTQGPALPSPRQLCSSRGRGQPRGGGFPIPTSRPTPHPRHTERDRPNHGVSQRGVSAEAGFRGPSPSEGARREGSRRSRCLFFSGLMPSSAPLPRSTWGAAEYPIESIKGHSLKGMRGAVWAWVRHLHS